MDTQKWEHRLQSPRLIGKEGYYSHNHAIRASLTDTWGQELVLTPENKYEMTFHYQIPETIGNFDVVIEDMEIVAFVADYDATNNFNCRVHNAEAVALK